MANVFLGFGLLLIVLIAAAFLAYYFFPAAFPVFRRHAHVPNQVVIKRGRRWLFRLWIVGSALFAVAVAFICYSKIKSDAEVPWAKLEMCATIAFGIPLVVLILGWAFLGSAAERS